MKHRIIAAIVTLIMTAASVSAAPMPAETDEPERVITEYAVPKGEHWSVAEKRIAVPVCALARNDMDFSAVEDKKTTSERAVKDARPYEYPADAEANETTPQSPCDSSPDKGSRDEGGNTGGVEFVATAYCPCAKCCGSYAYNRPIDENGEPIVYTATGTRATQGRTIAVDPRVIPYGTHVLVNGVEYVAEDCGGAIKGQHIDVYFSNHEDAAAFAVQTVTLEIIG